jgi:hypothetical protein
MSRYNIGVEIDELRERTVDAMRLARGNEAIIRSTITDYLKDGLPIEVPEALTDYFCVDTPSILDDAGFPDSEAESATALFDEIAKEAVREFFRRQKNKFKLTHYRAFW